MSRAAIEPGASVRPHRRQFVLGPSRVVPASDWQAFPLGDGRIFSHCPDLRLTRAADRTGRPWLLVGLAVDVDPDRAAPCEAIAARDGDDVASARYGWCGRWILVGPHAIWPDAGATLSCYVRREGDGALWASSSPALIAACGARPPSLVDPRRLAYERGLSWFPPPASRYDGVSRLLPSQRLDLSTGRAENEPLMPAVVPLDDAEAVAAKVARAVGTVLRRLKAATGAELHLGLTAGADSRSVLAAALAEGVDVDLFTRLTPRMSAADRVLPGRLARAIGMGHRTVRDGAVGRDRRAMFREHADDTVSDGDALPFLSGVRDELKGIVVGGHGFEIAGGHANLKALPETMPDPEDAADLILASSGEPLDSPARAGLVAWATHARQDPVANLDWRARYFIEQRSAGWRAAKETVYDMQDGERVSLTNASEIFALLQAFPRHARERSGLQRAIVRAAVPPLDRFPYNPPDRDFLMVAPRHVVRRIGDRTAKRAVAALERFGVRPFFARDA